MLVHIDRVGRVQDKEKPADASLSHDYSYHDREKYQRLVDTEKNIIADDWTSEVFGGTVDPKSLRSIRPGAVTGNTVSAAITTITIAVLQRRQALLRRLNRST